MDKPEFNLGQEVYLILPNTILDIDAIPGPCSTCGEYAEHKEPDYDCYECYGTFVIFPKITKYACIKGFINSILKYGAPDSPIVEYIISDHITDQPVSRLTYTTEPIASREEALAKCAELNAKGNSND